jgi:hypothetical protein
MVRPSVRHGKGDTVGILRLRAHHSLVGILFVALRSEAVTFLFLLTKTRILMTMTI